MLWLSTATLLFVVAYSFFSALFSVDGVFYAPLQFVASSFVAYREGSDPLMSYESVGFGFAFRETDANTLRFAKGIANTPWLLVPL